MFANIKNGQLAKRKFISQQKKKVCESFLKILWDEEFILGYSKEGNKLKIFLKYHKGRPAINSLKLLSRPGRRVYYTAKQLWKFNSSKGVIILSTNQGLKSLVDCKKLRIGGEPFLVLT
jgi:small subunit ribosomal protein S8